MNIPSGKIESPDTFIYVIKSVSCTTRAAVLSLVLEAGGVCVCEVEHALGISQPVASRALALLKSAGFLTSRQAANRVCYRRAESLSPLHEAICQAALQVFKKDPQFILALERLKSLRQKKKTGGCGDG